MSRDREGDSTPAGIVSSNSNIRFRNQSPSANQRRSRERERVDSSKDLNQTLNQSSDMTVDHMEVYDESRLVEDILGYPSLNSDEMDCTDSEYNKMYPGNLHSTPSSRHNRTNSLQAIDRLTTKIACTKESIRKEQTARDGKVSI